jgi:hypothetical protein
MLDVAEYTKHAEQCRELAKQMSRPEDSAAYQEMARTWEKLAALHELNQKLKSSD